MKITKAIIGVGVLAALGASVPGFAGGNKFDSHTLVRDCGDGDTVTWNGAQYLWPPNHKLQDASVTATDGGDDGASDTASIAVTPSVQDDLTGGDGGSQHDPDFIYTTEETPAGDPSATVGFQLRSERSGKGEGRTYTIDWTATFDGGAKTCSSPDDGAAFTVFVPHDMRNKADYS